MATMGTQQWIEFLNRELEKRKWVEGAKEYAEGLQRLEIDRAKVEAARDAAREERDKTLRDIEERRKRDATMAAKERADLVVLLAKDQDKARQVVTTAESELARVLGLTKQARLDLELAEAQRDAFRKEAHLEAADLIAKNTKLHRELEANRERLTAALKV